MKLKKKGAGPGKRPQMRGNANASKSTRKLQIGLKENTEDGIKTVRGINGGGTREDEVPKIMTMTDLTQKAKGLFFPNGRSPVGDASRFTFCMMDMYNMRIEDSQTVEEEYIRTKTKLLRLYLYCQLAEDRVAVPHTLAGLGDMGKSIMRPMRGNKIKS